MPDVVVPHLAQVVIDSTDARASAEFWRALLGLTYQPGHEPPSDGGDDVAGREWLNLNSSAGGKELAFQQVDRLDRPTWPQDGVPQQLHLDLTVPDAESLAQVHERALALGATVLEDRTDDTDEPLWVYADPDGHPFCVFVWTGSPR